MIGIFKYRKLFIIALLFNAFDTLFAQSIYLKPESIKNVYQSHLLIQNTKQLKFVESHLPNFRHIEKLRIDGEVDINAVSAISAKIDALDEIQLFKFQGILSDADLFNLEWVPSVYLYIPHDREDAILLNNQWSLIQKITLHFETAPESWEFLKTWKSCREITLLGDFNRSELESLITTVQNSMPKLKRFGVSVPQISDLPKSVSKLKQIKYLDVIDGADIATGILIEEMGESILPVAVDEKTITVGQGPNMGFARKDIFMPLRYLSTEPKLLNSDIDYIHTIFPTRDIDPNTLWYDEEVATLDFAKYVGYLQSDGKSPVKNGQSKSLVSDFTDGAFQFHGQADRDELFLGDAKWALSIPKNALQKQNGEVWLKSYQLNIQYADNPERIFSQGIHLGYDSANTNYLLDAGSYINIQAFAGNEVLKLRPGYFMDVRFVANFADSSRFYAYNAEKHSWEHFHDYDYSFTDDFIAKIDFYQFHSGKQTAHIQSSTNVEGLNDRFEKQGYNYLMPPRENTVNIYPYKGHLVSFTGGPKQNPFKLTRGRPLIRIRIIPNLNKSEKNVQEFEIYDQSMKLFPELAAFKSYVFAFKSSANRNAISGFFKSKKIIDMRLVNTATSVIMELKTTDGIWEIDLLTPNNRYQGSPKKQAKEEAKFQRLLTQYHTLRNQKALALEEVENAKQQQEIRTAFSAIFGAERLKIAQRRGGYKIRSFGQFCYAKPFVMSSPNQYELILCQAGKIPLETHTMMVLTQSPQSALQISGKDRFDLKIDPKKLLAIATKDKIGNVYVISGEAFRKLNIKDNTTTYIDLTLLPKQQFTTESISKYLGIKQKRK